MILHLLWQIGRDAFMWTILVDRPPKNPLSIVAYALFLFRYHVPIPEIFIALTKRKANSTNTTLIATSTSDLLLPLMTSFHVCVPLKHIGSIYPLPKGGFLADLEFFMAVLGFLFLNNPKKLLSDSLCFQYQFFFFFLFAYENTVLAYNPSSLNICHSNHDSILPWILIFSQDFIMSCLCSEN